MSNLIVSNVGENAIQDAWNATLAGDLRLSLYQNNYTPVPGSLYGNFTKATFTGYTDELPSFGASVTVSGKGTLTDTSVRTFIMGVPGTTNTIYGYYVWVDTGTPGSEILLWAEKFDAPQAMMNNLDEIDITLKFTLDSEF